MLEYLSENKEWIFSGIGILAITVLGNIVFCIFRDKLSRKKPKIHIKYSFYQAFVQTVIGTGPVYPVLGYELTNIGEVEVIIKSVSLDFCGKKITYLGFDDSTGLTTDSTAKKNKRLGPKEYDDGKFEVIKMVKIIGKQLKENSNIRIQAIDTLGNRYYSKKFKYRELIRSVEISNGVNFGK